jgi:hypothetical protein
VVKPSKVKKVTHDEDKLRDMAAEKPQRNGCEIQNPFCQSVKSTICDRISSFRTPGIAGLIVSQNLLILFSIAALLRG